MSLEPRHVGPSSRADDLSEAYERLRAWAAGGERRFERAFHTSIATMEDGWISLTELDDDFHSMRIALDVGRDGVVREAAGRMLRHPYDTCPRAIESLAGLLGANVRAGGMQRRLAERVPRDEGCVHIADMLVVAFRAFRIAQGHDLPEGDGEEMRRGIIRLMPRVRNTCVSFAVGEGDGGVAGRAGATPDG